MTEIKKALRNDRHDLVSRKKIFDQRLIGDIETSLESVQDGDSELIDIDAGDLRKIVQLRRKSPRAIKHQNRSKEVKWVK